MPNIPKMITTNIYMAAFLTMYGAVLKLKWFDKKCEFTLTHPEMDKLTAFYEESGHNVNAKLFVSHYKEIAKKVKNLKT